MLRARYITAFLAFYLGALHAKAADSSSVQEAKALRGCEALRKKIGPQGTTDRTVLQKADKVVVSGMPVTAERQPIGAKIFRVENGRFFLECQKD